MQNKKMIRKTKSVCPVCLANIDAEIIERGGKVFLSKSCASHGEFSLLVSNDSGYYAILSDYYFPLMDKSHSQRDYIVHLTNRCDLNCPICLAGANMRQIVDYPLESLKEFLKHRKGFKIDLMGSEPAMRDDLPEIIRLVKKTGNIAALHTNGNRIAEYGYLKRLKDAGLDEVHLQFDGFSDDVYRKLRGRGLAEIKERTLKNLEKLNISTDLVVTIVRGINEGEVNGILNFAVRKDFVKEVFFLGCRYLGNARNLSFEGCIMPDELIDVLQRETNGKITRDNILKFQKLYFALLSAFSVRKCFYINHFLITRSGDGYATVDQIYDLDRVQKDLGRFRDLKISGNRLALAYLIVSLAKSLFNSKTFAHTKEFFSLAAPFMRGFNLSKLPKKSILIGFISACDAYSFDYEIAKNCGKGAVSVELGIQDTGAIDNVLRDKMFETAVK